MKSLPFIVGSFTSWASFGIGYLLYVGEGESIGIAAMVFGIAGVSGFKIWAVTDALKVARVNNMAWRDKQGNARSLNLQPYIGTNTINNSNPIGLSVKLTF